MDVSYNGVFRGVSRLEKNLDLMADKWLGKTKKWCKQTKSGGMLKSLKKQMLVSVRIAHLGHET